MVKQILYKMKKNQAFSSAHHLLNGISNTFKVNSQRDLHCVHKTQMNTCMLLLAGVGEPLIVSGEELLPLDNIS